jgi:hypothetical protein
MLLKGKLKDLAVLINSVFSAMRKSEWRHRKTGNDNQLVEYIKQKIRA